MKPITRSDLIGIAELQAHALQLAVICLRQKQRLVTRAAKGAPIQKIRNRELISKVLLTWGLR